MMLSEYLVCLATFGAIQMYGIEVGKWVCAILTVSIVDVMH
jgi:hypothetical protein